MKGDSLVKEIQLKNFRSLKDTGIQTLSPITLLVGENSSGKSTFLRAFPLIKQSISQRTSGPILWAGDVDDYVDFGSFQETVTNDGSNSISFAFRFNLNNNYSRIRRYRFLDDHEDNTTKSSLQTICYEITITSSNAKDRVSKLSLTINKTHVDFDLDAKTAIMDSGFSYFEKNKTTSSLSVNSTISPLRRYFSFSHCFGFRLPLLDGLIEQIYQRLSLEKIDERNHFDVRQILIDIGISLISTGGITPIKDTRKKAIQTFEYVDIFNRLVSIIQEESGQELKEIVKLLAVYDIFQEIEEQLYTYFRQVHYIAPLRATAERYYRLRNLAVDEVDYQGKNLPIFINSLTTSQLKDFNSWTDQHFGFIVKTDKSTGHLSLQIKLHGSDKSINLSDTGFGYSQVLPIITQLWELASRKRYDHSSYIERNQQIPVVIAIEQPELHLHPAMQAKLAKAFLACIDLGHKNNCDIQLLLETHSETIVNYFGRAIARGKLNPEDISVILFEKSTNENETVVRNSYYDSDGFLSNWPYGFFTAED